MPKANRRDPAPAGFQIYFFFPFPRPYPWQRSSALCPAVLLLSPAAAGALPVPISGAAGKCSLAKCFCPWLQSAFSSRVKARLFLGSSPRWAAAALSSAPAGARVPQSAV